MSNMRRHANEKNYAVAAGTGNGGIYRRAGGGSGPGTGYNL